MNSPTGPMPALRERVAGRYRLEALLAQGGMSSVYRAFDESNGTRVALKRRTLHEARDARMFEREYHTLVSLKHPRIIEAYEYGVDAHGAYYTMELLDGADLRELALSPYRVACRHLRDVASSLALLHARRLLHRDITPSNVRVTGDGRCKLIDFGVLASFGVADVVAGTPPFVPPEALSGAPLDQRADLFSLGALAYWLLTGRHAFPARAIDELPMLWRNPPAVPSEVIASSELGASDPIPEALDVLVLALLSTNPLARPVSAAEVIDRLTAIAGLESDIEPRTAESYFSGTRTVGREREQARLLQRLTSTLEGIGTSLAIEADPGLGSSRLLSELAIEAQLRGVTPLVIDAKLRRGAYASVHDLIGKLLKAAPEQALRAAQPHAGVLGHFSPELRARLPEAASVAQKLAPGELRMRVQTALADWLFAISAEQPLLLVVDNAHRLDDASAALFTTLAYSVRDHKIMLVAAFKPSETSSAALLVKSLSETGSRIQLGALRKADVEQLVRGLFGDLPHLGRLAEQLYRSSGGSPQACMDLARHLVRTGVIRHAGGVWVLPSEISSDELPAGPQLHSSELARLSPDGRKLAEALSVHRGRLSLERCLTIAEQEGIGDVWNALEGLTRDEVLSRAETTYYFVHDKLREHLVAGLEPERRKTLHRRIGEAFAAEPLRDVNTMLDAGFHLVQGGEEGRGADLLAAAGLLLGYDSDEMAAAIRPLRAALTVFRKQRRPSHEIVKLVGPLCNAGWYCDRRLADEFGDEALSLLADLVGLSLAARLRPWLGKALSLYVGLAMAAVRFTFGKGYGGIAALRNMIVLYFNCVMSVVGVAATCLDAPRARHFANKLEHLTALGANHSATLAYRVSMQLSKVPLEYIADTIAGYRDLLVQVLHTQPTRDFPEDSRLMIVGGVNYALGALESFRDSTAALEHADTLDGVGLKLYAMVADQVRANYHACRGESELASYYRDRVEMQAIQAGWGWQAELWAPASAIVACLVSDDMIGMKRTNEELERLAREVPSLRRHAAFARAGYRLLRGDAALARDIMGVELANAAPRSFIGWGVMLAAQARCCNVLGDHAQAKQLCETTLAQLSAADQALTAMYLSLHLELAVADTHLGQHEPAIARIEALIDKHRSAGAPVVMSSLHRTRALIALHLGQERSARRHASEMERWVEPTRNPALLQQCEKLRAQIALLFERDAHGKSGSGPQLLSLDAEDVPTAADLRLKEATSGADRVTRALALVVSQMRAQSGYLFALRGDQLQLLAPQHGAEPPEHVVDQVQRDIRVFRHRRRLSSNELDPSQVSEALRTIRTAVRPKERDYRTVLLSVDGGEPLGAAVVLAGERPTVMREAWVRQLARSLVETGDLPQPTRSLPPPTD
jgi:hypothetical protein